MTTTQSPAARLAAVLRVLAAADVEVSEGHGFVHIRNSCWTVKDDFNPDSKDDLARVVAMLSPGQQYKFDLSIHELYGSGAEEWCAQWSRAITAPASVWLDALEASVK